MFVPRQLKLSCAKSTSYHLALADSVLFAEFSASKGQRDFDGQPNDAKKKKRSGKTKSRKDSQPIPDWKWQRHGPHSRVILRSRLFPTRVRHLRSQSVLSMPKLSEHFCPSAVLMC